ncbi:MAG: PQQ-dependent catabolism-associated CXXCW motif protein [Alphaproteobacteria bacterium]|nr:PQQ-dependent catabolism-associated CXXCW motif protein [Alphaproteobacteria bacterium]
MRKLAVSIALALLMGGGGAWADDGPVPELPGYRLDNYRAPVPLTVAGGTAIATEDAKALWTDRHAIFVDVLPAPRRPEGQAPGAVWKPLPRLHIPGSLWLPDVGRGEINERLESYFRDNLERITGRNKAAPVVFYCLADCWMSWNAAKRAISYGYTQVYWYRDGTDGWTKAQLPTEAGTPAPGWP